MKAKLKTSNYKTRIDYLAHSLAVTLTNGADVLSLPLNEEDSMELSKSNPHLSGILHKFARLVSNSSSPSSEIEFSDDDLAHFSKEDLLEPAAQFTEGRLLLAYKTVAAIRFWGLQESTGLEASDLEALSVPEYLRIKTRVSTDQNFGSPDFRFRLQLATERGQIIFAKPISGHAYKLSDGQEGIVPPSIHRLVSRLAEHESTVKTPEYKTTPDIQRAEFSEIRRIALKAHAQMDRFSAELNVVVLERLPFEFQELPSGEVRVAPVMPIGLEELDLDLQEEIGKVEADTPTSYLRLKARPNIKGRSIVVLSEQAKADYLRITAVNAAGPAAVHEAIEDPQATFGQLPRRRTKIADTFSDRIVGFVFGKLTTNRSDSGSGTEWSSGFDDHSTIIRTKSGGSIPIQYSPTPALYEILKRAYANLADQIKQEENRTIDSDGFIYTPLPPELERTILVPELNESFGLTELHHCCKRIELENLVKVEAEEIPSALEAIASATNNGRHVVEWRGVSDDASINIPVESLKRSIQTKKEKTPTENVSPAIAESVSDMGIAPQWYWRRTELTAFKRAEAFKPSVELRHHQCEGLAWLKWIFEHKPTADNHKRGALLADDMGLGKTIQILALIAKLKELPGIGQRPILIVAPVSLINDSWIKDGFNRFFESQWIERHVRTLNSWPVRLNQNELIAEAKRVNEELVSSGKTLAECEISEDLRETLKKFEDWAQDRVVVTSYEKLRANSIMFASVPFLLAILDEAQKIKNVGVLQANAAKALKADMCIAMTGTPIENSLMDLWGIMDFVLPGKLGSTKEFRSQFIEKLKEAPPGTNQRDELRRALESRLAPVWLRRTKQEVFRDSKDLPSITHYDSSVQSDGSLVNIHAVEMSPSQRVLYDEFMGIFLNSSGGHRLASIRSLLEVCSAPWLAAEITSTWDAHSDLYALCPKLKVTMDILDAIRRNSEEDGRKVIIFANVIQVQNSLAYFIADWNRRTGGKVIDVEVYNGEASASVRSEMLDRFKKAEGFAALIISPRAGGAGLNITEANHVIHYTREWNPALERQATDRVYRIGQKRPVHVYYPTTISSDSSQPSAEEHLSNILRAKREVMDDFTVSLDETGLSEDDLTGSLGGGIADDQVRIDGSKLSALTPDLFERLLAAVYKKRGMQVHWVGGSGDRGADIVCVGPQESFLVQAKHTATNAIQHSAGINEVRGAKSVYESRFGTKFQLRVVSNGSFSEEASLFAYQEGDTVDLLDGRSLTSMLEDLVITLADLKAIQHA